MIHRQKIDGTCEFLPRKWAEFPDYSFSQLPPRRVSSEGILIPGAITEMFVTSTIRNSLGSTGGIRVAERKCVISDTPRTVSPPVPNSHVSRGANA